uniref:Heme-binding protein 2 n=1 Tax=Bos taurus TaxID=9913 RepID=A0AAA9TLP0_BOVIN
DGGDSQGKPDHAHGTRRRSGRPELPGSGSGSLRPLPVGAPQCSADSGLPRCAEVTRRLRGGDSGTRRRGGPERPGAAPFLAQLAGLFPGSVGAAHGRGAGARFPGSRRLGGPRGRDAGLGGPGGCWPPEMKIKMTAPVTSYVEPGSGPFSESTITISLYIPSEQQSDPPRPAESDVFIEDRAEMTVFVRSFDGFSSAQKNQEQLLTLASILREEGKVFDEKVYYTAGYNSPFKLLDRNNEVWLIQKNEPSKERE